MTYIDKDKRYFLKNSKKSILYYFYPQIKAIN
jgi:hypothetical protein